MRSTDRIRRKAGMKVSERRTCKVCGVPVPGDREVCPVCALRAALSEEVSPEESGSKPALNGSASNPAQPRFENHELVRGEDGKPVELGRGAMGVTYKAFDIDLHCPVTLKVISERYLGDESARLRFLREARAAASVRHPNVAWVERKTSLF